MQYILYILRTVQRNTHFFIPLYSVLNFFFNTATHMCSPQNYIMLENSMIRCSTVHSVMRKVYFWSKPSSVFLLTHIVQYSVGSRYLLPWRTTREEKKNNRTDSLYGIVRQNGSKYLPDGET
jgi:hypothetical protein